MRIALALDIIVYIILYRLDFYVFQLPTSILFTSNKISFASENKPLAELKGNPCKCKEIEIDTFCVLNGKETSHMKKTMYNEKI